MKSLNKCLFSLSFALLIHCPNASDDCIDESKIDPNAGCETIYAPVCGCDGKTYGNACGAEVNGVRSWTDGECK